MGERSGSAFSSRTAFATVGSKLTRSTVAVERRRVHNFSPGARRRERSRVPHVSGGALAATSGENLELVVVELALVLGLEARRQVRVGRRLWGAERRIDVVLTEPVSRRRLGLECKFQGVT